MQSGIGGVLRVEEDDGPAGRVADGLYFRADRARLGRDREGRLDSPALGGGCAILPDEHADEHLGAAGAGADRRPSYGRDVERGQYEDSGEEEGRHCAAALAWAWCF